MKAPGILIVAFLMIGRSASAQSQLVGTVTGEDGATLEGVSVVVGDHQRFGTTTDREGRFSLNGSQSGDLRIRMSYIGYEPVDTTLHIEFGRNVLDLMMRRRAVLMREAEVSALRADVDAPFAQSMITREELERTNTAVDIPVLLDLQPSVVTTTDAGTGIGYTGIRIRGTDATRINVTLNGVPFNDAESQGTFFVDLPDLASSTEDIQVQRGVGTSTNGPGAFGASINLRTSSIAQDAFGELSAVGGSYNTQRFTARFGTGIGTSGLSLDGRLSTITSDGYIDRATADLKSYFLQGAWVGRQRSLRFIAFGGHEVTYQAWGGVPRELIATDRTYNPYTYENELDDYEQAHYQLLFDQELGDRTILNITGFRVDGNGYFENYKGEEASPGYFPGPVVVGNDTVAVNDFIIRRWLDNTLHGVNASVTHGFGRHELIVGGSYSDYGGDHFGEVIWARYSGPYDKGMEYYRNDARKTDANLFAKLDFAMSDRIDLYLDAQVRNVDHEFLGYDDDLENITQRVAYSFFNPKAGVNWRVHEGGRTYASIAVANREPNREDLTGSTPMNRASSERLTDIEAGYERRTGRIALGANVYYMDYTDQLVLTGDLNDVGGALRTNVPKSYRTGVEFTWAAQLSRQVLWKGNATFGQSRIKEFTEFVDDLDDGGQVEIRYEETPIAFSPELIAASELGFTFWKVKEKGQADLAVITKYVGEQYLDNSGSDARKLDAYVVNDLRLNLSMIDVLRIPTIALNITVRNLFSELYESNGWSYSYVQDGQRQEYVGLYPQAPINVMIGLSLRF